MLRVGRASRYIEEADALLRTFASECEGRIIASYDTQAPIYFPEIHPDLALAVSDAIHNLRAALDYIVYELALHDSGAIQEGTQFPLEVVKSGVSPSGNRFGFDALAPRFLKGLSDHHRNAIENLQPYKGVNWTRNLRDISNPDKHRRLTPFFEGETLNTWVYGPNHEGKTLPNGDTVHVDATHTIFIDLPDRKIWVVHSLYEVQAAVMDTINAFKAAF